MIQQFFNKIILGYLRIAAKIQLFKIKPRIIGVTGSAGKTSTCHAIQAVLKNHFTVKISYKANSETGLPLNLLGLQPVDYSKKDWLRLLLLEPWKLLSNWDKYDYYIAEMAIDSPFEPKNMSYLLKIMQPEIGVFLNAAPMHSFEFDQLAQETEPKKRRAEISQLIAAEKGKMITSLPEKGVAILNTDDNNVINFANKTSASVLSFGTKKKAEVQMVDYDSSLSGSSFKIQYQNQTTSLNFTHYLLPSHYGLSFAAALAVGISQGLSLEKAARSLEANYKLPPGRASLIPAINNAWILDSSYNASAQPVIDSLNLVNHASTGRKSALLGDIRELGEETKTEHLLVAKKAAQICDLVCLVGPQTKKYIWPYLKEKNIAVKWFKTAYLAAEFLQKKLQKDDLLLVKGSQNTLLLEIAVEKLMKHPERAEQILCRRGQFWDKRRLALKK